LITDFHNLAPEKTQSAISQKTRISVELVSIMQSFSAIIMEAENGAGLVVRTLTWFSPRTVIFVALYNKYAIMSWLKIGFGIVF